MAKSLVLQAFVLWGYVSVTLQFCFDYHCPHATNLAGCVRGNYICQDDEFCAVQTHAPHGNSPWVSMACQPIEEMQTCFNLQYNNNAACDPNRHDYQCRYCCETEECVHDLVNGVVPSVPSPGEGSTIPTVTCQDLYLGSCPTEFATQCADPQIQELCESTCGLC